jgi:tyrosyl-tRNA synthetase
MLDDLEKRGLLFDIANRETLKPCPFYLGIDPTAPSLQIGNLVGLLTTARLAQAGYEPIILFGGATGSIGDPSGKSAERRLLDRSEIQANIEAQKKQVSALFSKLNITPKFVDNYDWTHNISILDFLRDTGKHFTVNYMLAKDSVKNRIEGDGISFTEFSYMLLQALDFLHLYENHGCKLQVGGSDQWGNMTAGLELIRRKVSGEASVLCWPLLTDKAGRKFGKSEADTIWLDPKLTSPYKCYQYLLNVPDDEVIKLLKIFSFKSLREIEEIEKEFKEAPEKRIAQKELAESLVTLIHGNDKASEAINATSVLFGGGNLNELPVAILREVFSEVPHCSIKKDESISASELFVKAGAVKSKAEARRLISGGGAYVQGERVNSPDESINLNREVLILRSGKKSYFLIEVT